MSSRIRCTETHGETPEVLVPDSFVAKASNIWDPTFIGILKTIQYQIKKEPKISKKNRESKKKTENPHKWNRSCGIDMDIDV